MFGRGLWTPDEPREADIAWRMSRQSDRTLPQLAGTPFLEKPPLSYWMSGAAISLFGDSAAAERAPNLLYAAVTAVAVGALALAMDTGADAALIAALVAASALTAFRVGVWLALDATLGHRNAPGKYLFELPFYLLPWTPVVAAALVHAWRRVRESDAAGTAWRFALGASLPFLALLSLAATARDIYAAPAILGLAALAGLWSREAERAATRLDRLAVTGTRVLVAALAGLLLAALALLILSGAGPPLACLAAALGAGVPAIAALLLATRSQQRGDLKRSLHWSYTAYAAAVSFSALALLPVLDRWQDLPGLARRIHADCARAPLALLDPDETTIAVLDHGLDTRFTILTSDHDTSRAIVTRWFSDQGREARVLILVPGHARGALTRYLEHFHAPPPESDGVAGSLTASGAAALVRRYELPQGRRYALLGPPPPPP